jgi:predicted dienelactone hydrolase
VVRGRAEGHKHAVLTESGEPVADALFGLGRRGPDGLAQLLQRGALVSAQGCEVLVDGLGFNCHGLWYDSFIMHRHLALSALLVALACGPLAGQASAFDPPAETHAAFHKFTFTYKAGDAERKKAAFLWYPTATAARRFDYRGQIGFVAPDAAVLEGTHPLILFSHGFLGAGDQTIFLMEELARKGYIVAAVNHADALVERFGKPIDLPNFFDAKSWDDKKFRDRKEDLAALLDHLLAENKKAGSFLHEHVNVKAIGGAGHSLGGYTLFGMAGGWESWRDDRIRAVLLLSPYTAPFLGKESVAKVKTPVMLQGGTLDFGITPFLPGIYDKLTGPKYYLVLKNETHFGWTNLISLGKTTTECIKDGNAQLMTDYAVAFFDRHLRDGKDGELLERPNKRLESYQHTAGR